MPIPRLVTITAWSYSRYGTYSQCPRKAKYSCIDKLKEPDSAAGMKGTRVHAIAAMITTGKLPNKDKDNAVFHHELAPILKAKAFPVELETFKEEFKALKKQKVIAEANWCFDKSWQPVSWFGAEAWLRIKVDAHYVTQVKEGKLRRTQVVIIDHKTGKWNADHALQRELYALGAFLMYPDAETVSAAHWYLDLGKEDVDSWQKADLPKLQKLWLDRTTAMLNDTTFATSPSDKCRWCAFSKAKEGPCEF